MDANAILSALIGGKASRVFAKARNIDFVTSASVIEEIQEYIPVLAQEKKLDRKTMEAIFSLLPLEIVPKEAYNDHIPAASAMVGWRDPEDVELLALALAMGCPIWSNDNDLKELTGIKVYTTAEILQQITN